MRRDQTLLKLRELKPRLADMNIRRLAIFGSVARDDDSEDSDVDLLVDFIKPVDFIGYLTIREKLEDYLGSHVDLVTFTAARKPRHSNILQESIDV